MSRPKKSSIRFSLEGLLLLRNVRVNAELPLFREETTSVEITDRYQHPLRTASSGRASRLEPVGLADIAPAMILATLAAEDRRFFDHHGVDFRAIGRALWQDARQGRVVSGGSTVTQQLVRLLEPRPKTWSGKAREALRALWLERHTDKEQILRE